MTNQKQYAERDILELDRAGQHYIRHVTAMTAEGLHSKSDIAAELAWRDAEIERLRAKAAEQDTEIAVLKSNLKALLRSSAQWGDLKPYGYDVIAPDGHSTLMKLDSPKRANVFTEMGWTVVELFDRSQLPALADETENHRQQGYYQSQQPAAVADERIEFEKAVMSDDVGKDWSVEASWLARRDATAPYDHELVAFAWSVLQARAKLNAQPVLVVPESVPVSAGMCATFRAYGNGWNDCRATMLAAAPEPKQKDSTDGQ